MIQQNNMESLGGKRSNGDNNISKSRTRQHISKDGSYLSYMPIEIVIYILSFLPLRDWIVMSVVSKKWKDLWTHISQLNFNEDQFMRAIVHKKHRLINCFRGQEHTIRSARRQFAEMVDRTIRLHSGCTINNFQLSFQYDAQGGCASKIDSWVHFSMTKNIKELELNFSEQDPYRRFRMIALRNRPTDIAQPYTLPSCHFAPKIMTDLVLNVCKFRASSFRVFPSLRRLSLRQVEVLECSIVDLVSICPVLEDLSLEYCVLPKEFLVCKRSMKIKRLSVIYCITVEWPMVPIEIVSPDLLTLAITGTDLMKSSVGKALHLIDVTIDIRQSLIDSKRGSNLRSLLATLRHCKSLNMTTWCIQVLTSGENMQYQLSAPLNSLTHLRLEVGLVQQELHGIYFLLRSCPNLEALILDLNATINVDWDMFPDVSPNIYESEQQKNWENSVCQCLLPRLKRVYINGYFGKEKEMRMIQFLLKSAIVLESMSIYAITPETFIPTTPKEYLVFLRIQREEFPRVQEDTFRMLFNYQRASKEVQITVFNRAYKYFGGMGCTCF